MVYTRTGEYAERALDELSDNQLSATITDSGGNTSDMDVSDPSTGVLIAAGVVAAVTFVAGWLAGE